VSDAVWPRADTFIWLDYPMTIVFGRVFQRTMRRWWRQEELWSGNRERLGEQFLSRDSLFLWVVQSWRRHRRDYPKLLQSQVRQGKRVVRFRRPAEANRWFAALAAQGVAHGVNPCSLTIWP